MSDSESYASDPELYAPESEVSLGPGDPIDTMLETLGNLINSQTLLCFDGVFPVKPQDLILYYRKEHGQYGHVDFSSPTPESLERLSEACDAATFGRNKESVLDETYRRAGKMDTEYFAMNFNPAMCGLLPSLRDLLLEGHPTSRQIRAELYKLNVYGPGSFFKMHKDTPREPYMFGSLVVVLPTPHVGGDLHFRHGNLEHTFDSAAAVREAKAPCVGFAAFFSDLDHEVLPVESGFRVTLTYNLYSDQGQSTASYKTIDQSLGEAAIARALKNIVSDPEFLPQGGYLGFGLYHQYACEPRQALSCLKGTDSLLAKITREMSLIPKIKYVYGIASGLDLPEGFVLCNESPTIDMITDGYDKSAEAFKDVGGELFGLIDPDTGGVYNGDTEGLPVVDVVWATPKKVKNIDNGKSVTYAVYGNAPEVGHMYGTMCLVVKIPKPSERRDMIAGCAAAEVDDDSISKSQSKGVEKE